jgi:hypothetical protein
MILPVLESVRAMDFSLRATDGPRLETGQRDDVLFRGYRGIWKAAVTPVTSLRKPGTMVECLNQNWKG